MPRFKSPKGDVVEVTEEFAEQVLRPQGKYVELKEEAPVKVVAPKVSKKKTIKKGK